jgi:uncharacterized protein involved in exopolysaccharide biosynthesis
MNTPFQPALPVDEPISVRELLAVLFLRKRVILAVLLTSLSVTAFLVFYLLSPTYEASTTITIRPSNFVNLLSEGMPESDFERSVVFQTQKDVIKSGTIATRVVEKLALDKHHQLSRLDRFKMWLRSVKRWFGAKLGIEKWQKPEDMRALAIEAVFDKLEVLTKPESIAVKINYRAADPKEAADTLNAVIEVYRDYYNREISERAEGTLRYLDSRMDDARHDLSNSETAMLQFRRNDALKLETKGQPGVTSATTPASPVAPTASKAHPADSLVGITDNTQVQNEVKLYVLSMEEDLRKLRAQFPESDARIVDLRNKIAHYLDTMNAMPGRELELFRLKRDLDANQDTYLQLRKTYTRAKIVAEGSTDKISLINVVDRAEINDEAVSPNPKLAMMLALALGLAFGIVAAFVLEYLDHRIKTPRDIERHLGIRMIGSLQEV